jgi:hypothetical protein
MPSKSAYSTVGIETSWTAGVRLSAGAKDLSPFHSVQTGSGAQTASHPTGTEGYFPWGKAA